MTVVGLVSDTHDNHALVEPAVAFLREQDPALVLHLGDITAPSTVARFEGLPVRFLRGNNDGDPALRRALARHGFPPLEDAWRGRIDGVRLGATHGHLKRLLPVLAQHSDLVLHGHTHRRRVEAADGSVFVNPGALHRVHVKTMALLHVPENRVEFYEVRPEGVVPLPAP